MFPTDIPDIPTEKLFQIYVIDRFTNAPVYNSLVVAFSEIEAIKKAGITFDPKAHRVFIRVTGYEYKTEAISRNLPLYEDTPKSASCFDIIDKLATKL